MTTIVHLTKKELEDIVRTHLLLKANIKGVRDIRFGDSAISTIQEPSGTYADCDIELDLG